MKNSIEFVYKGDFDDFDTESKGFRNDVFVRLPSGLYYEVFFYDAHRIKTEIQEGSFIAHPGMIILDIVNRARIEEATQELFLKGFFNYFNPITDISSNHFDENI